MWLLAWAVLSTTVINIDNRQPATSWLKSLSHHTSTRQTFSNLTVRKTMPDEILIQEIIAAIEFSHNISIVSWFTIYDYNNQNSRKNILTNFRCFYLFFFVTKIMNINRPRTTNSLKSRDLRTLEHSCIASDTMDSVTCWSSFSVQNVMLWVICMVPLKLLVMLDDIHLWCYRLSLRPYAAHTKIIYGPTQHDNIQSWLMRQKHPAKHTQFN